MLTVWEAGPISVSGETSPAPAVGRVEVVLDHQYQTRKAELKAEFAQAGLPNVHFQICGLANLYLMDRRLLAET